MEQKDEQRNHGPQPLDEIMTDLQLSNHELVAASPAPLTHKTVQRARKGRWLTPHSRRVVTEALQAAILLRQPAEPGSEEEPPPPPRTYFQRDLFNYQKTHGQTVKKSLETVTDSAIPDTTALQS